MSARSWNRYCATGLILWLALAGPFGCRREPAQPPRQAILLLLDAARPDRFSCYGYDRATTPEMDRLAARGVVFHRHFAQGTRTRMSVSSLMYSRYFSLPLFPNSPDVPYSRPEHLFRGPDDAQISFVKALESAGFTTAAITAHLWTGENTAFAAEFTEVHDLTTRPGEADRPYPLAEAVIEETIDWIRRHENQDYFLYVHLMDSHYPHPFESDAQMFFGADSYNAANFLGGGAPTVPCSALSDADRRYVSALYDGSLRYIDRQIGRLAAFLDKEKLLDHTVIAITADHGEYLFEEPPESTGVFRHGGPWLDPVARIPLILHDPVGLVPGRFAGFSEGVDVAPTLLSLLGVELPPGKTFDGVDLTEVISGRAPRKEQVLMRRGIRTAGHKCLFRAPDEVLLGEPPPSPQALRGRLHDLIADPDEMVDLFQAQPELVSELLARYRASMAVPFQRFKTARSARQPRSAFAISSTHFITDVPLPEAGGPRPPDGWSRRKRREGDYVIARNTVEPLSIRFPLPNGNYVLSANMRGHGVIEVGNLQRSWNLTGEQSVEFGEIGVTDEVFRATLRPYGDRGFAVAFFGFVPPEAQGQDADTAKKRLDRLRGLGYVGSDGAVTGDD